MTEENVENMNLQSTFTFERKSDNPEKMFESAVDGSSQNSQIPCSSDAPCSKPSHSTLQQLYAKKQRSLNENSYNLEFDETSYESPQKKPKEGLDCSEQQEDETPELYSYLDLTSKLESALHKISSSKKTVTSTSRSNKSLILRFQQLQQKKKDELKKLQEQKELEIIKEVKKKPTINHQSQKIAKDTGYEPIHLRYEQILVTKKKKQQINDQNKKKLEEEKQTQFFEEFNQHCKKPDNMRTYDQYFAEMVRWKEKSAQQNKAKLQKKQNEEIQGLTFQPKLNEKSKKIMEFQQRPPISERGLVRQKVKPLYSFTPAIGRKPK